MPLHHQSVFESNYSTEMSLRVISPEVNLERWQEFWTEDKKPI